MAIYRIDNVERSGIGQYGEVVWNFPEAYNDAKGWGCTRNSK
jgi:hypothetical protein